MDMTLFQTNSVPAEIKVKKSEMDALRRRLDAAAALEAERNRLAQQVAALTAENEALRARAAAPAQSPAAPAVTEPGSIAEQAFRVNGVMDAAQKAADDYLAKIKEMHDVMSRQYSEYEVRAQIKADAIIKNANEEADAVRQKARAEVNAIWSALQDKFDGYVAGKKQ